MFKELLISIFLAFSSVSIANQGKTHQLIEEHAHDFCEIHLDNNEDFNQPKKAYTYKNHCWYCGSSINSKYNTRCNRCGWYICKNCGRCEYTCERWYKGSDQSRSSSSSSDESSWIWYILGIGLVIVGGYGIYYYFKHN